MNKKNTENLILNLREDTFVLTNKALQEGEIEKEGAKKEWEEYKTETLGNWEGMTSKGEISLKEYHSLETALNDLEKMFLLKQEVAVANRTKVYKDEVLDHTLKKILNAD